MEEERAPLPPNSEESVPADEQVADVDQKDVEDADAAAADTESVPADEQVADVDQKDVEDGDAAADNTTGGRGPRPLVVAAIVAVVVLIALAFPLGLVLSGTKENAVSTTTAPTAPATNTPTTAPTAITPNNTSTPTSSIDCDELASTVESIYYISFAGNLADIPQNVSFWDEMFLNAYHSFLADADDAACLRPKVSLIQILNSKKDTTTMNTTATSADKTSAGETNDGRRLLLRQLQQQVENEGDSNSTTTATTGTSPSSAAAATAAASTVTIAIWVTARQTDDPQQQELVVQLDDPGFFQALDEQFSKHQSSNMTAIFFLQVESIQPAALQPPVMNITTTDATPTYCGNDTNPCGFVMGAMDPVVDPAALQPPVMNVTTPDATPVYCGNDTNPCGFVMGAVDPVVDPVVDLPPPVSLDFSNDFYCTEHEICRNIVLPALDPAIPSETRPFLEVPGTCQQFALHWLTTTTTTLTGIAAMPKEQIQQRYALAVFYCALNGGDEWVLPKYANSSTAPFAWLSAQHECDWIQRPPSSSGGAASLEEANSSPCVMDAQSGIRIYQTLHLEEPNLNGRLPQELAMLSMLKEIHLSHAQLGGRFPDMRNMSQLETLILSHNGFQGAAIPNHLWELGSLKHLDLSNNKIGGAIYSGTVVNDNLKTVYLENNQLSGTLPFVFQFMALEKLHLWNNTLWGTISPELAMGSMQELLLHSNSFTGDIPATLFDQEVSPQLSILTLFDNNHYPDGFLYGDLTNLCLRLDDPNNQEWITAHVDRRSVACECCGNGDGFVDIHEDDYYNDEDYKNGSSNNIFAKSHTKS